MKNNWRRIISIIMLFALLFSGASIAYADIELRYVNAWQALNSDTTFYNKTVAQHIYDESNEHHINPRLILTLLQRESSAIFQTSPSSTTRAAWPLFYMYNEDMADCLNGDESKCADTGWPAGGSEDYRQRAYDFGGVGQQIAYAAYNFENKYNFYASTYSDPISIDGQTITCANAASRVMYAYTPHIVSYNETSAFYSYWSEWWGSTPSGDQTFDPNNIISNANFSYVEMSVQEIETFLSNHGENGGASWLANFTIPEYISVPYPAVVVPPAPAKAGDANGDSVIDLLDLSVVAANWGNNNTSADLNADGIVDLLDLSIVAANWGL